MRYVILFIFPLWGVIYGTFERNGSIELNKRLKRQVDNKNSIIGTLSNGSPINNTSQNKTDLKKLNDLGTSNSSHAISTGTLVELNPKTAINNSLEANQTLDKNLNTTKVKTNSSSGIGGSTLFKTAASIDSLAQNQTSNFSVPITNGTIISNFAQNGGLRDLNNSLRANTTEIQVTSVLGTNAQNQATNSSELINNGISNFTQTEGLRNLSNAFGANTTIMKDTNVLGTNVNAVAQNQTINFSKPFKDGTLFNGLSNITQDGKLRDLNNTSRIDTTNVKDTNITGSYTNTSVGALTENQATNTLNVFNNGISNITQSRGFNVLNNSSGANTTKIDTNGLGTNANASIDAFAQNKTFNSSKSINNGTFPNGISNITQAERLGDINNTLGINTTNSKGTSFLGTKTNASSDTLAQTQTTNFLKSINNETLSNGISNFTQSGGLIDHNNTSGANTNNVFGINANVSEEALLQNRTINSSSSINKERFSNEVSNIMQSGALRDLNNTLGASATNVKDTSNLRTNTQEQTTNFTRTGGLRNASYTFGANTTIMKDTNVLGMSVNAVDKNQTTNFSKPSNNRTFTNGFSNISQIGGSRYFNETTGPNRDISILGMTTNASIDGLAQNLTINPTKTIHNGTFSNEIGTNRRGGKIGDLNNSSGINTIKIKDDTKIHASSGVSDENNSLHSLNVNNKQIFSNGNHFNQKTEVLKSSDNDFETNGTVSRDLNGLADTSIENITKNSFRTFNNETSRKETLNKLPQNQFNDTTLNSNQLNSSVLNQITTNWDKKNAERNESINRVHKIPESDNLNYIDDLIRNKINDKKFIDNSKGARNTPVLANESIGMNGFNQSVMLLNHNSNNTLNSMTAIPIQRTHVRLVENKSNPLLISNRRQNDTLMFLNDTQISDSNVSVSNFNRTKFKKVLPKILKRFLRQSNLSDMANLLRDFRRNQDGPIYRNNGTVFNEFFKLLNNSSNINNLNRISAFDSNHTNLDQNKSGNVILELSKLPRNIISSLLNISTGNNSNNDKNNLTDIIKYFFNSAQTLKDQNNSSLETNISPLLNLRNLTNNELFRNFLKHFLAHNKNGSTPHRNPPANVFNNEAISKLIPNLIKSFLETSNFKKVNDYLNTSDSSKNTTHFEQFNEPNNNGYQNFLTILDYLFGLYQHQPQTNETKSILKKRPAVSKKSSKKQQAKHKPGNFVKMAKIPKNDNAVIFIGPNRKTETQDVDLLYLGNQTDKDLRVLYPAAQANCTENKQLTSIINNPEEQETNIHPVVYSPPRYYNPSIQTNMDQLSGFRPIVNPSAQSMFESNTFTQNPSTLLRSTIPNLYETRSFLREMNQPQDFEFTAPKVSQSVLIAQQKETIPSTMFKRPIQEAESRNNLVSSPPFLFNLPVPINLMPRNSVENMNTPSFRQINPSVTFSRPISETLESHDSVEDMNNHQATEVFGQRATINQPFILHSREEIGSAIPKLTESTYVAKQQEVSPNIIFNRPIEEDFAQHSAVEPITQQVLNPPVTHMLRRKQVINQEPYRPLIFTTQVQPEYTGSSIPKFSESTFIAKQREVSPKFSRPIGEEFESYNSGINKSPNKQILIPPVVFTRSNDFQSRNSMQEMYNPVDNSPDVFTSDTRTHKKINAVYNPSESFSSSNLNVNGQDIDNPRFVPMKPRVRESDVIAHQEIINPVSQGGLNPSDKNLFDTSDSLSGRNKDLDRIGVLVPINVVHLNPSGSNQMEELNKQGDSVIGNNDWSVEEKRTHSVIDSVERRTHHGGLRRMDISTFG